MRFVVEKQGALVAAAARWIGTRETRPNGGAEVEAFQKAVDGKAAGEPWCMAFVQYCVAQVDARVEGPNTWLFPSEHCLTVWNRTTAAARVPALELRQGDLIVWQHFKEGKPTPEGHVGVVAGIVRPGVFETIEGNTSDASAGVVAGGELAGAGAIIVRDGEGVFRRVRDVRTVGSMRFRGGLRAWGVR